MLIKIEVKASAKVEELKVIENNYYKIRVKASREKGKANRAVIKILKKYFGKDVRIVSGHSSTVKVLEVVDE
jgi:uncharacterized protein (TIGR00251 family)